MRLHEALNSGKRIKRGSLGNWFLPSAGVTYIYEDLISDNWQVEPDIITKEITDEQFTQAWDTVRNRFLNVKSSADSKLFQDLKRELFGV